MRGIGALLAARAEQALGDQPGQQQVQHLLLRPMLDHPGPELAEHSVVEPRVVQVQPQRVHLVQPHPHRISGLPVGHVLGLLQHAHQRQPAR